MKKNIAVLFSVCFLWFYGCSKHIPSTYEVVSFTLSNSNNINAKPFDAGIDSVPKKAYAIKMTLAEHLKTKTGGDPQDNGFKNEDQVYTFNIYSLNNFDGSHPAGASLNDYFLTALNSSFTIANFISEDKFGQGHLDASYQLVDDWNSDQYLFLMSQPTLSGNYSFVVNIGMSDGRQMADTVTVKLY